MKPTPCRGVAALEKELLALRDPKRAEAVARFFKCGEGEYGAGDQFLGLTVPAVRTLARTYRGLPVADLQRLMDSPWHEARLMALVLLVDSFGRTAVEAERAAMYRFYLRNLKAGRINNWDLVDVSCGCIIGGYLADKDRAPLYRMARSKDLWTKRVGIISTFEFIRAGESQDTLRIAEILLHDTHDLIHKAVGWMLREVGKRASAEALNGFLERHAATMPRTMLRYAIERLEPKQRADFMGRRAAANGKGRSSS